MAKYYSFKGDFNQNHEPPSAETTNSIVKMLRKIKEGTEALKAEDLAGLYVTTGEATFGKEMPDRTFQDAREHAANRLASAKKVHHEVMENIDGKFFEGIDNALNSLNNVDEGDHTYRSDHLTYEQTREIITKSRQGPSLIENKTIETTTELYTISDIINSDKSPIPAARELYKQKLAEAKEYLNNLEKINHEQAEKLKQLDDHDLVNKTFPTQNGKYERARSTAKEKNKGWLIPLETGLNIGGTLLLMVSPFTGPAAPFVAVTGSALVAIGGGVKAATGETISGTRVSDEDRIWAGADALLTVGTGGIAFGASMLAKAGKTIPTTLRNLGIGADVASDIVNGYQAYRNSGDPLEAFAQIMGARGAGKLLGTLGSKVRIRRTGSPDVDVPNGGNKVNTNPTKPRVDSTDKIPTSPGNKGKAPTSSGDNKIPTGSKPKDVNVNNKKPKVEGSRQSDVTKPNTTPGELPKAGQPRTSPSEPSKKVQKPGEVDAGKTKDSGTNKLSELKNKFESRVQKIRQAMPNSALRNRGNVAVADVQIDGLKSEFVAHSRVHSDASKGADVADFSMSRDNKIFKTYVEDKFPRYNDTEVKILEDIASQIKDPNIKGKITLFTELPPCESCSNVIAEFKKMFPNIEVNVLWK